MTNLSVNVNKIAWLRNARGGHTPNILELSELIIDCGVSGITVHPRPDLRHITPDDVYTLRELTKRKKVEFNVIHPIRVRNLSPAFATTVHKAQGSEAEHVIFLWPEPINQKHSSNSHPLYNKEYERKLIYTAITRAKSNLDLVITLDK